MAAGRQTTRRDLWGAVGALVAVAAFFAAMFLAERVAGQLTEGLLRTLDMLRPDPYYTGTPQVLEPALWLLTLLYSLPVVLAASFVSVDRLVGTGWAPRRLVDLALTLFAVVGSIGIMWFAFDPSRSGRHVPLIRRWEAFSYEAADLVFAATWVMIAMTLVMGVTHLAVPARGPRAAIQVVAFVGLTATLGTLFA